MSRYVSRLHTPLKYSPTDFSHCTMSVIKSLQNVHSFIQYSTCHECVLCCRLADRTQTTSFSDIYSLSLDDVLRLRRRGGSLKTLMFVFGLLPRNILSNRFDSAFTSRLTSRISYVLLTWRSIPAFARAPAGLALVTFTCGTLTSRRG